MSSYTCHDYDHWQPVFDAIEKSLETGEECQSLERERAYAEAIDKARAPARDARIKKGELDLVDAYHPNKVPSSLMGRG